MITILAVGKKHEDWVIEGIVRYQKRLRTPYDVAWELIPHSSHDGDKARTEESERLRKRVGDGFVVLLDERGRKLSSPDFSLLIESPLSTKGRIVVVIGGAYGVDDYFRDRANAVVSLSNMVFPHQLVRLILVEQLYRAQSIATGGKYHHE